LKEKSGFDGEKERLRGKRVLVTGSARGIGKRLIQRFAGVGCGVAVNYMKSEMEAEELTKGLAASGVDTMKIRADVTSEDEVEGMMEQVGKEWDGLDILVNNVGDFLVKPLSQIESSEWHRIINSNLHSTFYCCRHALPLMRRTGWGRVINMSWSDTEHFCSAFETTPYVIAKTGIITLTKSLAVEEASYGITVNVVLPGVIDNSRLSEKKRAEILEDIPVGRLGKPDDVAEAVLFLASERSSYITGTTVTVSGGWHLER
jgi:NAD(P)-dependent dehydrogenase (short-subunit alcohol dehydrogenase family)